MSEEGMIAGYNKKTLVRVFAVIVIAGAIFYIGAKYEKNKLSKLGLLNNGTSQNQTASAKKEKTKAVATTQKFVDQAYYKNTYLISGATLSADAQKALAGFVMSKKTLPDGTTTIALKAQKPEYHDQMYTLKAGEQLYLIEKSLLDDVSNIENNINDDSAVLVDAQGNIVAPPLEFSK